MIDLEFDESILILEDNQDRIVKFRAMYPESIIVQEAHRAIECLSQDKTVWNWVSLDHDLKGELFVDSNRSDCGMEVVRWIVKNRPSVYKITIHSRNRHGSRIMYDTLKGLYTVERKPFEGEYDPRSY